MPTIFGVYMINFIIDEIPQGQAQLKKKDWFINFRQKVLVNDVEINRAIVERNHGKCFKKGILLDLHTNAENNLMIDVCMIKCQDEMCYFRLGCVTHAWFPNHLQCKT